MFSKKEQIIRKTGPNGVGRYQFLKLLLDEFTQTNYLDSKRQVLANIANFCYDPINFEFIRQLGIISVFINQLTSEDEELLLFSLAGLCNLGSDPTCRKRIIECNGISQLSQHLTHENTEIKLNALATLIFLITPDTQAIITTPENISTVLQYQGSSDNRLKNLGTIFVEDYCTKEQVTLARSASQL